MNSTNYKPKGPGGFVGLPVEAGLFLTANACGGLFPQAPAPKAS